MGCVTQVGELVPQGLSAELIAAKWGYSRKALDEYAARSQERAVTAIEKAWFEKEIATIIDRKVD